jgi:hypothetical protein
MDMAKTATLEAQKNKQATRSTSAWQRNDAHEAKVQSRCHMGTKLR